MQQLSAAGMNYVRLRVWVNPEDGFDNEAQLLAMAKQAAGYGQKLLLDFHYSDTWADPGHQAIPAAWASDTLSELETQVYTYSKQVVADLVAQGTPPAMVQVGNEINAGMLWPDGSTSNWPQLAALLKEGIAGVRAADSSVKIVLHLAGSDSEFDARLVVLHGCLRRGVVRHHRAVLLRLLGRPPGRAPDGSG